MNSFPEKKILPDGRAKENQKTIHSFYANTFLNIFFLLPQWASNFRHSIHRNDKKKTGTPEIWVKSNLISWCHPALECHTSVCDPLSGSQDVEKALWKINLKSMSPNVVYFYRWTPRVLPALERGKIPYFYLYFLPTRVETPRWGRNDIFSPFRTISFSLPVKNRKRVGENVVSLHFARCLLLEAIFIRLVVKELFPPFCTSRLPVAFFKLVCWK